MKTLKISGTIDLKLLKNASGQARKLDVYNDLVNIIALPSNPGRGIDYLESTKRSKILSKFIDAHESKKEFVTFENADFDLICECIKNYTYSFSDPAISEWLDGIINTPEDNVSAKKLRAAN